ncbi:phosphopantetheine-binding protein [Candidatus Thioglobus sp.]|nr:phosphopantetheine-binding protein [Candidatus Thioglobus sp.]
MAKNNYKEDIREFFQMRGYEVIEDTDLFESGAIDSMGIIELIVFIEEELGIKLEVSLLLADNFRNIDLIYKLLENVEA